MRLDRGDTAVDLHEEDGRLFLDCSVAGEDDVRALVASGLAAKAGLARASVMVHRPL